LLSLLAIILAETQPSDCDSIGLQAAAKAKRERRPGVLVTPTA